jgi:hypothetical protein
MTRLLSVHLMAASESSADHLPVVTDRPDLAWKIQLCAGQCGTLKERHLARNEADLELILQGARHVTITMPESSRIEVCCTQRSEVMSRGRKESISCARPRSGMIGG